jgi:soluble lytic murein transglycosylase-like protein
MPPPNELVALARTIAAQHSLDPALVCAVVEQESDWDAHSIRYEPAFRTRYVAPLGLSPTEEIARSISWGLMQVMGQVAREHGFTGKFLSALGDPAAGLDVGCVALTSKFAAASRELASAPPPTSLASGASAQGIAAPASDQTLAQRALLLWNGGANADYPAQVLARLAKYQ